MKHIKRLKDIGVASGVGAIMAFGLAGCGESGSTGSSLEQTVQKQGQQLRTGRILLGQYLCRLGKVGSQRQLRQIPPQRCK